MTAERVGGININDSDSMLIPTTGELPIDTDSVVANVYALLAHLVEQPLDKGKVAGS